MHYLGGSWNCPSRILGLFWGRELLISTYTFWLGYHKSAKVTGLYFRKIIFWGLKWGENISEAFLKIFTHISRASHRDFPYFHIWALLDIINFLQKTHVQEKLILVVYLYYNSLRLSVSPYVRTSVCSTFFQKPLIGSRWNFTQTFIMIPGSELNKIVYVACIIMHKLA